MILGKQSTVNSGGFRSVPTYYLTNFSRISPKNCMKMKKFWARGEGARPWRPFRSATGEVFLGVAIDFGVVVFMCYLCEAERGNKSL